MLYLWQGLPRKLADPSQTWGVGDLVIFYAKIIGTFDKWDRSRELTFLVGRLGYALEKFCFGLYSFQSAMNSSETL